MTEPKYVTQADVRRIIAKAWPEAERRLADLAFPREYNPTDEELREAHAIVASAEIWRLIREIVGADDSITYNNGSGLLAVRTDEQ